MASKKKLSFLVDHCVDAEIFRYLSEKKRIKVFSFEDIGLSQRAIDAHVLAKATQVEALLITSDKRFTENSVPFCTHMGIIKLHMRVTARLRYFKKFMCMNERHLAWKGVTHLFEEEIMINQHNGELLSAQYSK